MHAGFRALRTAMPMDLGIDGRGVAKPEDALADVARIDHLWTEALSASGGPYLFGETFTGADCMFAPVVTRFLTYAPPLSAASSAYCDAVRAQPLMQLWYDGARQEPEEWARKHG